MCFCVKSVDFGPAVVRLCEERRIWKIDRRPVSEGGAVLLRYDAAAGVGRHFAREFARHRIRRVVFVGAPRRQPGRPLATADGDWPALSAGEFAAHALRVGGAWAGGPPGRR